MLRLIGRYASKVRDQDNGILAYSYNIGFIDVQAPAELQYAEYVCNTNNICFAVMIFEAEMLHEHQQLVTVFSIDFNNLVKHNLCQYSH